MAQDELSQTYLEKPYTVFLFKALESIREKWVMNQTEEALSEACQLVVFLPNDVKDALQDQRKRILEDLKQAYAKEDVDWFTTQRTRNRVARQVANLYAESFFDEMTRLLDEKGWLERGALKSRFTHKRRLEV